MDCIFLFDIRGWIVSHRFYYFSSPYKFVKNEKKIKIDNVIHVTYNNMKTMNVKFGLLTIELKEGKDIKIYFEDINNDNEKFYSEIYTKIKKYEKTT